MKSRLTSDHRELDELLRQIFSAFEIGSAKTIFAKLDLFWARLAMHIRAEHLHLFPAILDASKANTLHRKTTPESVHNAIDQLRAEHDFFMSELAAAIKIMREINLHDIDETQKRLLRVQEKVSAVSEKLKIHNELEEIKVYQWMEDLLVPAERWVLGTQIEKELENLPSRFDQK